MISDFENSKDCTYLYWVGLTKNKVFKYSKTQYRNIMFRNYYLEVVIVIYSYESHMDTMTACCFICTRIISDGHNSITFENLKLYHTMKLLGCTG